MLRLTAQETARAVGGRLIAGEEGRLLTHISLDSRTMKGNDLFVPVIGERVDAHDFICQALENGASAVFTSRHRTREDVERAVAEQTERKAAQGESAPAGAANAAAFETGQAFYGPASQRCLSAAWIAVDDTRRALQALGSYLRDQISIPLVGVTGSVGKTTTREMAAAALSAGFRVYKTPGNSNSQVGVPITLAEIPEDARMGVIELGMSEPGEMTRIARVARVDCAIITNIGVAHIEQLGSQENILHEKLCIQDGMPEDGVLFLNGDDPLLAAVKIPGRRIVRYGMGDTCDYRCEDLRLEDGYPVFTAVCAGRRVPVHLRVMGSHMVSNALASLAVADHFGVDLEAAARRLGEFAGYKGRQQIVHAGGLTIIDDSYNASPASMKAGIEVLCSLPDCGRRIAVLADMRELGDEAAKFHREVGAFAAAHPVDCLVLFGELAEEIGAGAAAAIPCVQYCGTLDEVNAWLDAGLRAGDGVLFKGSNSMGLSGAVKHLLERLEKQRPAGEIGRK